MQSNQLVPYTTVLVRINKVCDSELWAASRGALRAKVPM